MPIYRQLFDFLSLASIAISIAKTEREGRRSPMNISRTISKEGPSSNPLPMLGSTCREIPKAQERSGGTGAKEKMGASTSGRQHMTGARG
jgi:hypothetical protein